MAKSSELFIALIGAVRPVIAAGASRESCISTVREQLENSDAIHMAERIVDIELANQKLTDAEESDVWEALIESVCESLQRDANAARDSFVTRLKLIAAEKNRRWLFALPVKIELQRAVTELSTVTTHRVIIPACNIKEELDAQFEEACRVIGIPAPGKHVLRFPLPTPPLFVALVQGASEPAHRNGMRSFYVGRDGLRFAEYVLDPQKDLGPVESGEVYEPLLETWLIEVAGQEVNRKAIRQVDVSIGAVELGRNPKKLQLYDAVARIMEMHPEDASNRLQKSLGGRLARSVRIFSRAVIQTNRDLRFLLILVAFEVLLNRKDAPIAESLADYGALFNATGVEDRARLSRELKAAYDARSRFVHDGQVPSEQLGDDKFAQYERVAFHSWVGVIRNLLPCGEEGWSDDVFFEKLLKVKFGATWKEVTAE